MKKAVDTILVFVFLAGSFLFHGCFCFRDTETEWRENVTKAYADGPFAGPGSEDAELWDWRNEKWEFDRGRYMAVGVLPGYGEIFYNGTFFEQADKVWEGAFVIPVIYILPFGLPIGAGSTLWSWFVTPFVGYDSNKAHLGGAFSAFGCHKWKIAKYSTERLVKTGDKERVVRDVRNSSGKEISDIIGKSGDGTMLVFDYPGFRSLYECVQENGKVDVMFKDGPNAYRRFCMAKYVKDALVYEDVLIGQDGVADAQIEHQRRARLAKASVLALKNHRGYQFSTDRVKDEISKLSALADIEMKLTSESDKNAIREIEKARDSLLTCLEKEEIACVGQLNAALDNCRYEEVLNGVAQEINNTIHNELLWEKLKKDTIVKLQKDVFNISDSKRLAEIFKLTDNPDLKYCIVQRLYSIGKVDCLVEEQLHKVIQDTSSDTVKICAINGISDRERLVKIARENDTKVAVAALKKIDDVGYVRDVALKNISDNSLLVPYLNAYGSEEEYFKVSESIESFFKDESLSAWNSGDLTGFSKAADVVCRINNDYVSVSVLASSLEKISAFEKQCHDNWISCSWVEKDEKQAQDVVNMFTPILTDSVREKVFLQNKKGWRYLIKGTNRGLALKLLRAQGLRYISCEVKLVDLLNSTDIDLQLFKCARSEELKRALMRKMPEDVRRAAEIFGAKKTGELIEKAKSYMKETFVFKGFYLSMPIDDAKTLLWYYDSVKDYSIEGGNVVSERIKGSIDNYDGVVVRGKEGKAIEFLFSRELIDQMFKTTDISADEFCKGIVSAYETVPSLEKKRCKVPDWDMRQTMEEFVQHSVGQADSIDEIEIKIAEARARLREIKTVGDIYCCYNAQLRFHLEIMPLDVKERETGLILSLIKAQKIKQTNFFSLKQIECANLNYFD